MCLAVLLSASAAAANATGFVSAPGCYNPPNESDLHLEKWNGQKLKQPIILYVPNSMFSRPSLGAVNVRAKECTESADCNSIFQAKIQILHVSRRFSLRYRGRVYNELSGSVEIKLTDGANLRGSFKVKVRYPPYKIVCE